MSRICLRAQLHQVHRSSAPTPTCGSPAKRAGHGLGQRDHDADRWIAATALRLGVPLVSNDRIFERVPGLVLESVRT